MSCSECIDHFTEHATLFPCLVKCPIEVLICNSYTHILNIISSYSDRLVLKTYKVDVAKLGLPPDSEVEIYIEKVSAEAQATIYTTHLARHLVKTNKSNDDGLAKQLEASNKSLKEHNKAYDDVQEFVPEAIRAAARERIMEKVAKKQTWPRRKRFGSIC